MLDWLMTGDEAIRQSARSAARSAARPAARSARSAAQLAWLVTGRMFDDLVFECFEDFLNGKE